MLSMGRCSQDDYYLVPVDENDLPEEVRCRFLERIEDVIPLENYNLLVFFRDGKVKKCSLHDYFQSDKKFSVLLNNEELFFYAQMQTGGYGVAWDINMSISDAILYRMGLEIPLSTEDFTNFVVHRIVTAAEAAEILDCSRQNIEDLTKRGKLHPVKSSAKTTLFLKSEILKRKWQ
jgi:hypothetical protein